MKKITLIDTLYAYSNLDNASSFYDNYVKTGLALLIGKSQGRTWYSIDGNRIGICSEEQSIKMNSYPFLIQYSKSNCHVHNFNSYSPTISSNTFKIQRIDTCIIFQKSDFTIPYEIISPFRSRSLIGSRNDIYTMYLGKRSNGKVLRIYNKSLELIDTSNYNQIDRLSTIFGTVDNLFTIELELRRSFIMAKFGDVTIDSLENLINYSLSVISSVRFFPNTPSNLIKYHNNNYNKIEDSFTLHSSNVNYFCKHDDYKNKEASLHHLSKSINRKITNYIDSVQIKNNSDLIRIYTVLFDSIIDNDRFNIKSLEFTIDDYKIDKLNHLKFLSKKDSYNDEFEYKRYFT